MQVSRVKERGVVYGTRSGTDSPTTEYARGQGKREEKNERGGWEG